ncbi:MAG TPA: TRAP transporter large permease [Myxococcales bacterium]|nr:TRAP transporter large permease [Myxococcales bacterium]
MAILGLFGAVMVLVLLNVPIAVSLAVVALLAILHTGGVEALANVPLVMYTGSTSFPLIAIPLFILAGAIMNASGISRRLIALSSAVFGFVRGALAQVTIVTSMFFAEISGSAVADAAALGSILIPAMKQKGYSKEFSAAVLSSSATLAVIIPPSIPMILYAAMADTSVVKLFVAGIIPGVLGGLLMMVIAWRFARVYDFPVEEKFRWSRVWAAFKDASWALILPALILGGIFGGVVTATEGAALAVLAAVAIGVLVYRELNLKALYAAMVDGVVQTAVVMLLVAASALLGVHLTEIQAPQKMALAAAALSNSKWVVLLLLNVLFLLLGLFLHSAAAIILVVPVVMPLVQAVGIDPVQFGIIITINLGIGQQTPPVASVLTVACSIANADMWEVTKVNLWFIAVLLLVLGISTYIPAVPLALVRLFYGS